MESSKSRPHERSVLLSLQARRSHKDADWSSVIAIGMRTNRNEMSLLKVRCCLETAVINFQEGAPQFSDRTRANKVHDVLTRPLFAAIILRQDTESIYYVWCSLSGTMAAKMSVTGLSIRWTSYKALHQRIERISKIK